MKPVHVTWLQSGGLEEEECCESRTRGPERRSVSRSNDTGSGGGVGIGRVGGGGLLRVTDSRSGARLREPQQRHWFTWRGSNRAGWRWRNAASHGLAVRSAAP